MVDQALYERLELLKGWDSMHPEDRFEAVRKADLLDLLDNGIGSYIYDELVDEAEREGEDLDVCLGYYITDPHDLSCNYYNISDLDQFESFAVMEVLGQLFPDLDVDVETDMDEWFRSIDWRERLGQIAGRGENTNEPGKL